MIRCNIDGIQIRLFKCGKSYWSKITMANPLWIDQASKDVFASKGMRI